MAGIPNVQFVTIASLLVGARLGARRGAVFILVAVPCNFQRRMVDNLPSHWLRVLPPANLRSNNQI